MIVKTLGIILCLTMMMYAGAAASHLPGVDVAEIPDYDYSQTHRMILYGPDGYALLGNPFDSTPNMGVLVYEIILLYVPRFQPFPGLPEPPTHVMDLVMKDKFDKDRLGQRLFIGNAWLSDGKSLALMKPADYELLIDFLHKRYDNATRYDPQRLENARRPRQDELPDDWQPEKSSVQTAINRKEISDYARYGYDPGAQLRRKGNRVPDQYDADAAPGDLSPQEGAVSSGSESSNSNSSAGRQGVDTVAEKSGVDDPSAGSPVSLDSFRMDAAAREVPHGGQVGTDMIQRRNWFFPAGLLMLGLLLCVVVLYRRHARNTV